MVVTEVVRRKVNKRNVVFGPSGRVYGRTAERAEQSSILKGSSRPDPDSFGHPHGWSAHGGLTEKRAQRPTD